MSNVVPFEQIVGAMKIYIATESTAEPTVTGAPGASWVELGSTEGEQSIQFSGALTYFYDNDHQGPVKVVRGQEDITLTLNLVDLTLEHMARALSSVANVTTSSNIKKLPMRRGVNPTVYALVMRGAAHSPYGDYPAQYYFPRVVQGSEPTITHGKVTRASLAMEFRVLEDDTQSDGNTLGWFSVQVS